MGGAGPLTAETVNSFGAVMTAGGDWDAPNGPPEGGTAWEVPVR
jgi:hypothetical protein